MGSIVPITNPYVLLVADPDFSQAATHWSSTWGGSFGVGWFECLLSTFVEIFPKAITIKITIEADYRFSTVVSRCNHTKYRHAVGGWASGYYSALGKVTVTRHLTPGNYIYTLQVVRITGVVDLKGSWLGVEGDNGGDVQAYETSIVENFVPPDKSKYEYYPSEPNDTILLANHDWPANVLIQRESY